MKQAINKLFKRDTFVETKAGRLRSKRWRNNKAHPVHIISVRLTAFERERCSDMDIAFELPEFEHWLFYPVRRNSRFKAYSPKVFRSGQIHPFVGVVRGGKWRFLFRSNGVKESENKVSRHEVVRAVEGSIKSVLEKCTRPE
jgi:hypothetical protein